MATTMIGDTPRPVFAVRDDDWQDNFNQVLQHKHMPPLFTKWRELQKEKWLAKWAAIWDN